MSEKKKAFHFNIRKAEMKDTAVIAEYNRRMAMETEGKELPEATALRGAKAIIKDPHKGFYLVAEKSCEIVGQLMVTKEWSDWRNKYFFWIQSVYIPDDHRRKGIYSALYRHLVELAKDRKDVAGIRLYVEKNNTSAQTTYEQLGMYKPAYDMYEVLL